MFGLFHANSMIDGYKMFLVLLFVTGDILYTLTILTTSSSLALQWLHGLISWSFSSIMKFDGLHHSFYFLVSRGEIG